ncbi:MAG: hypothetical protein WA667_05040 [Candidatus Nitrosopolaris sp.]
MGVRIGVNLRLIPDGPSKVATGTHALALATMCLQNVHQSEKEEETVGTVRSTGIKLFSAYVVNRW